MALLEIQNLKKYFKNIKAVDDITFSVEKGGILGLLGPNGAGKSTTISMIATLTAPDSGTIRFKGEDIAQNPKAIQQRLGLVPQEIALYPNLSGLENLQFWGRAYSLSGASLKKRIDEVSEVIGITERLKDRVKKYSGGMQRRLNIGAALLHNPEFIIMDEPTVGIDPQSRNHILDTVKELASRDTTIIYTSHYMEEVELLCDNVCIMDAGKIIAAGTKDEITASLGGGSELSLKLAKPDAALCEKLAAQKYVSKLSAQGDMVFIIADDADKATRAVLEIVGLSDVSLLSFDTKKPSLETVFLNLTGRALRD